MLRPFLGLIFLTFTLFLYGQETQTVSPAQTSRNLGNSITRIEQTLNYARDHQQFRSVYFKQNEADFVRLVEGGQQPQTLFITCSDSRVVPNLILNMPPGGLFVIRTAGNFVPFNEPNIADGVSATIQYAVEALNVKHIIVCGHTHCGAIEGLFAKMDPTQMTILQRWLRFGQEAKEITLQAVAPNTPQTEIYRVAEQVSVIAQLDHLLSFPYIKKRVTEEKINLHGWYFDIETGQIYYYNPEEYRFKPLTVAS